MTKLYFIDDDEASHIYHRLMAVDAGFTEVEMKSFYNVDDAIATLKSSLSSNDSINWPQYIFVDINMPIKSGYDFIAEVESILPVDRIPLIYFVSSTKNPTDIEKVKSIPLIKGFETKFLEREFFDNIKLSLN